MRLTRNFTLEELTATRVAAVNSPNEVQTANLSQLCERVLQPLRDAWGGPITVNSGFRSAAVNKAVGGVANSQHLLGQAADIQASLPPSPSPHNGKGGARMTQQETNKRLFQLAIDLGLPFDQLIDEKDYRWIHVSYSPRNRRQILHLK